MEATTAGYGSTEYEARHLSARARLMANHHAKTQGRATGVRWTVRVHNRGATLAVTYKLKLRSGAYSVGEISISEAL